MEISKFPEILGELSMHKQCVPGSFLTAHALEPGNEARITHAHNASCCTMCMSELKKDYG